MSEEIMSDDSSHYEVSLTGGQALAAFLLMLASLAASFGFGLMLGRGQSDDPLVRRQTPLITEEGGVRDRVEEQPVAPAIKLPSTANVEPVAPTILEEQPSRLTSGEGSRAPEPATSPGPALPSSTLPQPSTPRPVLKEPPAAGPFFAQVLSASDVNAAEGLAARLIEKGYTSAYVERVTGDRGMTYRVRVRYATEAEARAAVEALKTLTKGDVWVTR